MANSEEADCRGIDAEILGLDASDAREAQRARDSLAAALPQLDAQQAGGIGQAARMRLRRDLEFCTRHMWPVFRDVEYVVAAIGVEAHIGGATELWLLESIAGRNDHQRIREAAARAVPLIRERLASGRRHRRLLRPAQVCEELLTPAAAPRQDPRLLPRPAQPPGGNPTIGATDE